jgi:hypothetical protein
MTFSTRCMQPDDWTKLKFFRPGEFKYPEKMGYEFMLWVDKVRGIAGTPSRVTSDYRTRDPNGNLWRFVMLQAAMQLGCTRIGMYRNGSLHFDMTEHSRPSPRLWIQVDNPA